MIGFNLGAVARLVLVVSRSQESSGALIDTFPDLVAKVLVTFQI